MNLSFSISGEFITNRIREMFWYDDESLTTIEEYVGSLFSGNNLDEDKIRTLTQEIIEGRKKFEGTNSFELLDDNEKIKPIGLKLDEFKKQIKIYQIKEDMIQNPINYIDIYANKRDIDDVDVEFFNDETYYDRYTRVIKHFLTDSMGRYLDGYYEDTMLGTWLIYEPELIYKLNGGPLHDYDLDEFYEKLYNYVKEFKFSEFSDNKDFKRRQNKYEAYLRSLEPKEIIVKEFIPIDENKYHNINDMSFEEYANYLKNCDPSNLSYNLFPDDIIYWDGLISPKGEFFSCEFGGHNMKAFFIIKTYYNKFKYKTADKIYSIFSNREEVMEKIDYDRALDLLLENGWVSTHLSPMGALLQFKEYNFWLTKDQKNCIWDAIFKHNVTLKDDDLEKIL